MATKRKTKAQKEMDEVIKKRFEPYRKEMNLAYKRINGNSIRRLRWLLEFAEKDLDALSQGQVADVGWEVAMFSLDVAPAKLHEDFANLCDLDMMMSDPKHQRGLHIHPELVRGFQQKMKEVFGLLYAGEWWEYSYPVTVKRIAIPHVRSPGGALKADNWEAMPVDEKLELRAFELLEAEKARLMVCENPNCKKRFVATKQGRTRFHSPTCSAYVRIARSRGKKI